MSQYRPDLQEILRSVRELTMELVPQVDAKAKYDLRVAAYLLEMAEREVAQGPALDRKQQAQLEKLLGHGADGTTPLSVGALEAELASRLRKGELDDRFDEVLALVLEQTTENVAIVKPSLLASES